MIAVLLGMVGSQLYGLRLYQSANDLPGAGVPAGSQLGYNHLRIENRPHLMYQRAAAYSDGDLLEQHIKRVINLASADADSHYLELEALLLRYLELNPRGAVRFAVLEGVDQRLLISMYVTWASVDAEPAYAALGGIEDRTVRRTIAMAFVGPIARTEEEIRRLASVAVAGSPQVGFISDALARLAESDSRAAIQQALRLDENSLRGATVQKIAGEWARGDLAQALSYMDELRQPRLRHLFHIGLVTELVSVDPNRALEYVLSEAGLRLLSVQSEGALLLLSKLAVYKPREVLAAADRISGKVGSQLRLAALRHLVDQDLADAIDRVGRLPVGGGRREELIHVVAGAYARQDPVSALQWAQAIDQSASSALRPFAMPQVLSEIAEKDLGWAIELALGDDRLSAIIPSLITNRRGIELLSSYEMRGLADVLLGSDRSQQQSVAALMRVWPRHDREGAWNWVLEQGLDSELIRSAARAFASGGIELPVQRIYELPPESLGDWVTTFAGTYAQSEPRAALNWLSGLRAEADYDAWASEIATVLVTPQAQTSITSPNDPVLAAEILDTVQQPTPDITSAVALRWAQQSPGDAISWALNLRSVPESQRNAAVSSAVGAWTVDDPDSARQWLMRLPTGDMRDQALAAQLAQSIASHGTIDRRVLNSFSTEDAVRNAMNETVIAFSWLASREPGVATSLLDEFVDDSTLEEVIRESIDQGRELGFEVDEELTLRVAP